VPRLARSVFVVVFCLVTLPGWAAQRRVALIHGDAELVRALTLALSAWDVATLLVDESEPASNQPDAMQQAVQLASRLEVDGLVWTSQTPESSLLWVYDARTGQLTARVLMERAPFSSAAAAGIALSVKTALRASVQPPEAPAPLAPVAPSRPAPRPTPQPAPRLAHVLLRAGVDAQVVADHVRRAWFSLDSVVWLGARRRVGAGLRLGAAPWLSIEDARFSGRFRELAFGPAAEFRLLASRHVEASVFVSGAAHASFLDGTLSRDGAHVEATRYRVSIDTGAQIELAVGGGVFAGVGANVAYFPKYQRYLVEGRPIFSPWRLIPGAGAHLALQLP
jgi:hypothetical protein